MSSSQNLQPENEEHFEDAEDVTVPILYNRYRLLVVPRRLQSSYRQRPRESGNSLGKLKGFMDLPRDIVYETAMYLSPEDLLDLSRLSKQFRSIFASRSAIFVWKNALTLSDVDLKCYKDINEIQVASLLYERFCMVCVCGPTTATITYTMIRMRLCQLCEKENLVTKVALKKKYPKARRLIMELPASLEEGKCFKPEALLLIEKFLSLKQENSRDLFIANTVELTSLRREHFYDEVWRKTSCPPRW